MRDAWAGQITPAVVETTVQNDHGTLQVHMTVHSAETPFNDDGVQVMHYLGPEGDTGASVVIADGTEPSTDDDRFDALDRTVGDHPGALIVAQIVSDGRALVWVRVQPESVWDPAGYKVWVRSAGPAPVYLHASAMYGWMRWFLARLTVPEGFPRGLLLPRPPSRVDLVVDETTHRLEVTPAIRPVTHHDPDGPEFR